MSTAARSACEHHFGRTTRKKASLHLEEPPSEAGAVSVSRTGSAQHPLAKGVGQDLFSLTALLFRY